MIDHTSLHQRQYAGFLDLACEQLSDELAAIRAELQEVRIDRNAYRELLLVSLHTIAQLTQERDRARETIGHLRDHLRDHRRAQGGVRRAAA